MCYLFFGGDVFTSNGMCGQLLDVPLEKRFDTCSSFSFIYRAKIIKVLLVKNPKSYYELCLLFWTSNTRSAHVIVKAENDFKLFYF